MTNLLTDGLPVRVTVHGQEYGIDPDFRLMVRLQLLLTEDDGSEEERGDKLLGLLWELLPEWEEMLMAYNPDEIFRAVLGFYSGEPDGCGQSRTAEDEEEDGEEENERVYSFLHDSAALYTAFMQAYHIDLTKARLHWYQFRALLRGLPEDCLFSRMLLYRATDLADVPEHRREHYRRMKRRYALPLPKSEQDKNDAVAAALMNGGDLGALRLENSE